MLEEALKLHKQGLSIIPCGRDKRPLVSWLPFQERQAAEYEVREWWTKNPDANIAIVTGKLSGLTVIDCDSNDAAGHFRSIYKGETVTVKTPRGTHYYFKYAEGVRNTVKVAGVDLDVRGEGGYVITAPSINGEGVGYRWLKDFEKQALDSFDFDGILNTSTRARSNFGANTNSVTNDHTSHNESQLFELGRRDNDLFHTANCLAKGGMPPGEIEQVLLTIMQTWGEYDEKWARTKIQSAIERSARKDRNIMAEIKVWLESQAGHFRVTDYHNESHSVTKQEKHAANVAFTRLCEQGIIERYGERSGTYRKVENELQIIDWRNASTDEYEMEWPMGLKQLVKLPPKGIAIIAGAPNSGKSSFLIELVRLNEKKYGDDMLYANSEMSSGELRGRIDAYPPDMQKNCGWNFTAIERSDKFADVIRPNGFNIIDYLEIYDEFWKIGAQIKDIHKRLDKGIAVIAIQKNASTGKQQVDYGRGGQITLEKPRLYLAMDKGIVKIVKAKLWRTSERNPNGLTRRFKLVGGWKWLPDDAWKTEEEAQTMQKFGGYVEKPKMVARKVDNFGDNEFIPEIDGEDN
jgi:hypothetical protein